MNAPIQQVLDLGPKFREPAEGTVPLVVNGECWGRFVSPELRAKTQQAVERGAIPALARLGIQPRWL